MKNEKYECVRVIELLSACPVKKCHFNAIRISPNNFVYVVDLGCKLVHKLNEKLRYIRSFENSSLLYVSDVAIDSQENLFISDPVNKKICIVDSSNKVIDVIDLDCQFCRIGLHDNTKLFIDKRSDDGRISYFEEIDLKTFSKKTFLKTKNKGNILFSRLIINKKGIAFFVPSGELYKIYRIDLHSGSCKNIYRHRERFKGKYSGDLSGVDPNTIHTLWIKDIGFDETTNTLLVWYKFSFLSYSNDLKYLGRTALREHFDCFTCDHNGDLLCAKVRPLENVASLYQFVRAS